MKAGVEKLRKSTKRSLTKAKRFIDTGSTKPSTLSEHLDDFTDNAEKTIDKLSENLEGSLTRWTDSLAAWFWKKSAEAFLETYGFDGYFVWWLGSC